MKFVAGAFVAGALAAGVVAVGTASDEPPGPRSTSRAIDDRSTPGADRAPARLPAQPLATVRGSKEHTTASLLAVRRSGTKVVSAHVEVALGQASPEGWLPELEGDDGAWYTAEGLRLIDEINGREHFPLQDPDGECLCSTDIRSLERGERIGVYAKFPAPPPDVDRVSLHVPGFQSFDDIPLAR